MGWYDFEPYESVAAKKAKAERLMQGLIKKGRKIRPVRIQGKAIASSFWGKAWCDNIERYSDYGNRLPRGRGYVRHGSVVHLEVENGQIMAMVSGSSLYNVKIGLDPVKPERWQKIKTRCSGQIGSLIELLQGKLSQSVMKVVTDPEDGLFPKRQEIKFGCSCPDYAGMCKHIAAVLYGIGNRLDTEPEILFALRGIDHNELITEAIPGRDGDLHHPGFEAIAAQDLGDIFGIDLDIEGSMTPPPSLTKSANRQTNAKSDPKANPGRTAPAARRSPESPPRKSRRTANPAKASREVTTGTNTHRSAALTNATAKPKSHAQAKPISETKVTSSPERTVSTKAPKKQSKVPAASIPLPITRADPISVTGSKPAPETTRAEVKRSAANSDRVKTVRAKSTAMPIRETDTPNEPVTPVRGSETAKRRAVGSSARTVNRNSTARVTARAVSPKKPAAKSRQG